MNDSVRHGDLLRNFRVRATVGVAAIAVVMLSPFAINNFLQDRPLLGVGSLLLVVLCGINAWFGLRDRYHAQLIFWGLVPAITLFLFLAFRQQGAVVAFWTYPALLGLYFMLPVREAVIANVLLVAVVVPQAWAVMQVEYLTRFGATLVGVSVFSGMFVGVIHEHRKLLEKLANTDPLTGLYNRMLLNESLQAAIDRNAGNETPASLVALDIDCFKSINDDLGHDGGDRVLQRMAGLLVGLADADTRVFRTGGEEFLLLAPNADSAKANRFAEELRSGIELKPLAPGRLVTASIGVATLRPGEDREAWMKRCDERLYRAKSAGRNAVEFEDSNPSAPPRSR